MRFALFLQTQFEFDKNANSACVCICERLRPISHLVSFATIGVCVFCAVCFGSRTFLFYEGITVMMSSSEFINWRKKLPSEMCDLTYAHPNDIFIFTRFTVKKPLKTESKQVLYAEDIKDVIGYLHYIFLYDILTDAIDDVELDFKYPFDERQKYVILLLNYWFKSGKLSPANTDIQKLKEFCTVFNCDFKTKENVEYEIEILNGADELRKFLIKKYSMYENFDKKVLSNICGKELFVGKKLKDFLDNFLC